MGAMERLHPLAAAGYFAGVAAVAMVSMNPVLLGLSLLGSLALSCRYGGLRGAGGFLLLGLCVAVLNPLVYHNGVTPLLILNGQPITLEALCYGLAAGAMIAGVGCWLRSFSRMMTSDKLMHLLGRVSPKLALLCAMALRCGPLFSRQTAAIRRAQQGVGLYKEENLPDRIRGNSRVFSILVTWALENSIITADSMAARGYGVGRRTAFARYRFGRRDGMFLLLTAVLLFPPVLGLCLGALNVSYYPALRMPAPSLLGALSYGAYAALALLPILWEGGESLKWRWLKSRI